MTREEAIEVYNGLINQKIKEAFEFFAPELKESEDEKIRKAIRKIVGAARHSQMDLINDETADAILAWLEKQKNLTDEEYEQGKKDALWCINKAAQNAKDENEMGTCWFAEKWLEKQKPKPVEWSEEDTFKVQRICKYLDEAKKYYADITKVRDCIDWLKSFKERIGG